jgi:ssDNA-binding Zn-finger/Zn-ribbon topoisomerase 1
MYANTRIIHKEGENCPACSLENDKGGRLTFRSVRNKRFLGCSRFPLCKNTNQCDYKRSKFVVRAPKKIKQAPLVKQFI